MTRRKKKTQPVANKAQPVAKEAQATLKATGPSTPRRRSRWWEASLVALLFMALAMPLAYVHSVRWISGGGDTAFLTELAHNIAFRGVPYTQLNTSINAAELTWGAMAEDVCQSPLAKPNPPEMNQFKRHTYLILYALAPLLWIMDPSTALPSAMVGSFMILLLAMYLLLRERGVAIWGALLFVGALTLFPVWSFGVQGQIYADRLFIGFAAICLYLLSREEPPVGWIILTAALAASVIERGAVILGGALIAYAVIYAPSQPRKKTKLVLVLGGGIFLIAFMILKFYLESPYYQGFVSGLFLGFPHLLQNPDFVAKLKIFLVFNLGLFGCMAIFAPRPFFLALLALLPNIMGTMGGAEKTGWLSHYHSIYLPFIVWAAAMGFANLWQMAQRWTLRVPLAGAVLSIGCIAMITNPGDNLSDPFFSTKYAKKNVWPVTADMLGDYLDPKKDPQATQIGHTLRRYHELREAIPAGASVTTLENAMPSLILDHEVHYYPIAIESADYALIVATPLEGGGFNYGGEISYRDAEQKRILNECLNRRLKAAGYNVDTPNKMLGGYYLLTRNKTTTPASQPLVR